MKIKLTTTALLSQMVIGLGYADTTISTATTTPLSTATAGNIEITTTGQVLTGGDSISMNASPGTSLTVDPNNTFPLGAIITTSGHAVNITTSGNSVIVGAGSTISAFQNGLFIQGASTTVNNSGTIKGGTGGATSNIFVSGTGGNQSIITNLVGGIIQGGGTSPSINVLGAPGLTIVNNGLIAGVNAGQIGINNNSDFVNITNSGTISTNTGTAALQLPTGPYTGNITNSAGGNISGNAGNNGYLQSGPFSGTFDNFGTISVSSVLANSAAVTLNNGFGIFNNHASGIIQGQSQSAGLSIAPATVLTGTFINAGTIQSNNKSAVILSKTFTSFTNTGLIQNTSGSNLNPVVKALAGTTITGSTGFSNSGTITQSNLAQPAIDFGSTAGNNITLFQQPGAVITGNVILASNGGTVLNMSGGTITGNVNVAPLASASTTSNILNFTGGTVTGNVAIGIKNSDFLKLSGPLTQLNTITGGTGGATGNTFTIAGGNFTALTGGTNFLDDMFIIGNFTFNGPGIIKDLDTIEVEQIPGGVLPQVVFNSDIRNLHSFFSVDAGSVTLNANLIGATPATPHPYLQTLPGASFTITTTGFASLDTADNKGTLILNEKPQLLVGQVDNPALMLSGEYNNFVGGDLVTQIGGPQNYGAIVANSGNLDGGSFVTPILYPFQFIPQGSVYPIVTTTTGITTAPVLPTVNNPASAIISFIGQYVPGNTPATALIYELVAERGSYVPCAGSTPNLIALGNSLDALASGSGPLDPDIRDFLVQVDVLQTCTEVNNALSQLLPPLDYGMIEGANIAMDRSFYNIQRRLEDLRGVHEVWNAGYNINRTWDDGEGYNFGDCDRIDQGVLFGTWAMGYGELINQIPQWEFQGYKGNAIGVAIGMDWNAMGDTILGISGSVTKVNIESQNGTGNVQDILTYGTTFYAFFEPLDALYTSLLLGMTSSKFQNTRNILFATIADSAHSNFYGLQFGSQFDMGYVFLRNNFYTAPVVRMKWSNLKLDDYIESGAGGLSLTTENPSLQEWLVGGGVRFAYQEKVGTSLYVPEAEVMYLYAIENQGQEVVANFVGGGSPFYVNGIRPGRDIVLVDLGINAHTNDGYVFTGKFEWEWRSHFMGYSGFLQLYHRWG